MKSFSQKVNLRGTLCEILVLVVMLCIPALAYSKRAPLPDQVISAKSIYLDNQSGDSAVLDTATEEFTKWGRFTITNSKDDADLVAVFTHKLGIDKWGNASFIVMDVFIKGHSEDVLETKNAVKLITAPRLRTQACIADFKKRLEPKVRH
ncbi:hypothetical protein [Granulicella arctica]|uniref:Uncharacterized protein n=1 Tax=Granulicella arctica TaxID=940613 RepID=A0A7Y9PI31_9BACT|nr:hypothetical protein [Granulicella arctica]NYF80222.1 hypothetical protein [Granulicella arctica]